MLDGWRGIGVGCRLWGYGSSVGKGCEAGRQPTWLVLVAGGRPVGVVWRVTWRRGRPGCGRRCVLGDVASWVTWRRGRRGRPVMCLRHAGGSGGGRPCWCGVG